MILKSSLQSNYTLTTSWGETGLKLIIPEDGYYCVNFTATTNAAAGGSHYLKLAVDGALINNSGSMRNFAGYVSLCASNILYLRKSQVVEVYAAYDGSATGEVQASAETRATYIEAINLTKLARGGM